MTASITYNVSAISHVPVIHFSGKLDESSCDSICKEVQEFYFQNKNMDGLVLDFTSLHQINSKAIGHLMNLSADLTDDEKKLVISGSSSSMAHLFKKLGVHHMVDMVSNIREAGNVFDESDY